MAVGSSSMKVPDDIGFWFVLLLLSIATIVNSIAIWQIAKHVGM